MSPAYVTPSSPKARRVASTPESQSPECWNFVNLSEPKQSKDKTLRKFVRSNAMRDYRQKKKQSEMKHKRQPKDTTAQHEGGDTVLLSKSPLPAPAQNDEDGDCFESCGHAECVYDCRYSSSGVCSSPKQLLGDGATDPFDALPFEGDRQYTGYILKHFNAVMARNFLPVETSRGQHPMTSIWMTHAVADPLLFLATLNFAAAHLDIIHGGQRSPRTIAQKVETIRLINLRLQDSAETVSNTTIGAVAMLAAMESRTSNHQALNVHMDALEKMVKMRGGLQQLGWDGVLQMFISWQDLLSSTMLSAPPHFPRPPDWLVVQDDIPPSEPICAEFGAFAEVGAELIIGYNNMRHMVDQLATFDHSTPREDLEALESMRYRLETSFSSMYILKPKEQMQDLDYLLEANRLAGLIFLNRTFHGFCPVIRQLSSQMKELLLEKESHIVHEVSPQMTWGYPSWALFMGGIHSLNDDDIAFFAKRIAISTRVWQAQGFCTWPEILNLVKRVGWIDALQGPACDRLGNQVERFIRNGDVARQSATEMSGHSGWPAEFNTLLTAWSSAAKG